MTGWLLVILLANGQGMEVADTARSTDNTVRNLDSAVKRLDSRVHSLRCYR